jgi:hypothetical protein
MNYLRGSRSKVSVVAESDNDTIQTPYLGDIGDVRTMPEPSSGYDRANWFAQNTLGDPKSRASFASSSGRASIGSMARGVNGTEADDYWTDSYWTGYNVVNLPEQYTQQSDNVGSIWGVQTQASKGLNYLTWDQVYVNQDMQSVWS